MWGMNMRREDEIKLQADKMGSAFFIFIILFMLAVEMLFIIVGIVADCWQIIPMFLPPALFIQLYVVFTAHSWNATVTLTKEYISYKPYFKDPFIVKYNDLPIIDVAYAPLSIYVSVKELHKTFIILTNKEMTDEKRYRVNEYKSTKDFIKIAYSKEYFDFLCEVLPEEQKKRLVELFGDLKEK